jgi:hypothetical protein
LAARLTRLSQLTIIAAHLPDLNCAWLICLGMDANVPVVKSYLLILGADLSDCAYVLRATKRFKDGKEHHY